MLTNQPGCNAQNRANTSTSPPNSTLPQYSSQWTRCWIRMVLSNPPLLQTPCCRTCHTRVPVSLNVTDIHSATTNSHESQPQLRLEQIHEGTEYYLEPSALRSPDVSALSLFATYGSSPGGKTAKGVTATASSIKVSIPCPPLELMGFLADPSPLALTLMFRHLSCHAASAKRLSV